MIDIKQLTQDKAHLVELWKFLGLPEAMPDISLWQMDYGMDMIESGFKTLKKLINKGTDVRDVQKFLGKILHNSKLAKLTPEEYETYIAQIRAAAGALGAAKTNRKKLKEARAELEAAMAKESLPTFADRLPEFAETLPDVCRTVNGVGLPVKHVGDKRLGTGTASPCGSNDSNSTSTSKPSNLKPKTKKPKTCKQCGGPLSRDKNHSCENTGGTSRPPSPAASPSSADIFAAQAHQSAASPHLTVCPICEAPDLPWSLYDKHVTQCKAKHEQRAQAVAQRVTVQ